MSCSHLTRITLACLSIVVGRVAFAQATQPTLVDVRKIWDEAPHNAFTDLLRFHDQWYCVFREGAKHVAPDGALRVLTSPDGDKWTSLARITSPKGDLRDAKITVTPDGRLMLSGAAAFLKDGDKRTHHQSMSWFSADAGKTWDEGHDVADADFWLWRVTWHKGTAYGVGYNGISADKAGADRFTRLFQSRDGIQFSPLVERLYGEGFPNEATIRFLADDTALILQRRDGKPNTGLLGIARPPYTDWTWKDLGLRIGGPNFIELPDGRLIAAVRLHEPKVRCSLCWLDPKAGTLTECLALPSGGDCSYAGLAWHQDLLWVSYYSSHEGKTSIYLAKVKLPAKQ
jgi:hypothetical protein